MDISVPLEHAVVSNPKIGFLTLGSEPSHLRVRIRERCMATTQQMRVDSFTEQRSTFVTTATDSIEVA